MCLFLYGRSLPRHPHDRFDRTQTGLCKFGCGFGSGQVRPRQGTEICNFGAPSPLEALHWTFCFFSRFYVQFSKTSPLKSGESSEKSSGENRVKSCHVCGCHGFFGPDFIDLLMGLFRGAVFRHGGGALKQPIKEPTETPTSTLALMGRFPSLIGRFPTLMGRFTDFVLMGRLTS